MLELDKPGRFSDPEMTFVTDPRSDPRLVAATTAAVQVKKIHIEPIGPDSSHEACLTYIDATENHVWQTPDAGDLLLPDSVEFIRTKIDSIDGNSIDLHLHLPKQRTNPCPCIVYLHGGAMVMGTSTTFPHSWGLINTLAGSGVIAIGVEFRNGGGVLGNYPFPAGLNDCASSIQWVYDHREDLGLSGIVLVGESGGGNLAIAAALKANREGWVDHIAGVYAMCPYIYGDYAVTAPDLSSLVENDQSIRNTYAGLATVYDPGGLNKTNPLAWPYHADREDLIKLPPHVISVNELDLLRDEGLVYYRKLIHAGVNAFARTVHGTPHAGELMYRDVIPYLYQDTIASIRSFVTQVCRQPILAI